MLGIIYLDHPMRVKSQRASGEWWQRC